MTMAIPGELVLVDDVPTAFATHVVDAFRARPLDTFSLALSGGETARRCYEHLAGTAGSQIDWWKVDVYWGDERCVPHDDPASNYHLAREALLDRVGAANATHLMRCAEGPDPYQLRLGDLPRLPEELDRLPGIPVILGREGRTERDHGIVHHPLLERRFPAVEDLGELRGAVRLEQDRFGVH